MCDNKMFVLDLTGVPLEFSSKVQTLLNGEMQPYGLLITNFNIEYVGFDNDDSQVLRLQDIHGEAYKLNVLGDNYGRVRGFDIGEIAAANEGLAGGMVGVGMSAGIGLGLGNMMGVWSIMQCHHLLLQHQ